MLYYLSGRRRAEAKARRDLDDVCDRFEQLNEQTLEEIRVLRGELRHYAVEGAMAERAEQVLLH